MSDPNSNKEQDSNPTLPSRIFLIGYMGSGKTTVGRELSLLTGFRYVDMDSLIEDHEGMPIREIFIKRGEHHFRNLESRLLDQLCEQSDVIVSCGGGIIHDELNVERLQDCGTTVFLSGDAMLLFERVKNDPNRPLAYMDIDDEEVRFAKFSDLYKIREHLYNKAAAMTIDITGKTPEAIAAEILSHI